MSLIVRGTGVSEGETLPHLVLNNDLAPTFADIANVDAPDFVDGRSLLPLLDDDPTTEEDWRQRFLIEAVAERGAVQRPPFVDESEVTPLVSGTPAKKRAPHSFRPSGVERVVGPSLAQGAQDGAIPLRRV